MLQAKAYTLPLSFCYQTVQILILIAEVVLAWQALNPFTQTSTLPNQ